MTSHIKLYGGKSNRFQEIKEDLEENLGYEPSNPEVIGLLMADWRSNVLDTGRNDGTQYV